MHWACTGVGVSYPSSEIARNNFLDNPKDSKFDIGGPLTERDEMLYYADASTGFRPTHLIKYNGYY